MTAAPLHLPDVPAVRVRVCGPRKSGLTRLQLALLGKGIVQGYRIRARAQERLTTVDVEELMQPGHGR